MILKTGKMGIKKITNVNTNSPRTMMAFYKGMDISGSLFLNDNIINIGYNEQLEMESEEKAEELFIILHAVLVKGEEAEDTIQSIAEVAHTLFFQEVA